MVERYSVSLKETCGKRKFSVLEAREFIHVRLHYAMRDKVGDLNEFNEIDEEIRKAISYTTKDKTGDVIYHTLTTTQNCFGTSPRDISLSMAENIGYWKGRLNSRETQRKDGKEVLAWHMWQSFDNNSPHTCDFSRELGEKDNSGCDFCISWY